MGRSIKGRLALRYSQYRYRCKLRNVFWELSLENFACLVTSPCFYCGKKPSEENHLNRRGSINYFNGIDRQNPKRGYDNKNCVSCCWECNRIKGNRLSAKETSLIAKLLKKLRGKKK